MRDQKRYIIRVGLSALLILALVILMLTIFGEPSREAYNTRTVAQLQQYVTALELIRLENNFYPITEGPVCLGDYSDNRCWDKEGVGVKESALFNDMMDNFVPLLSAGKMVVDERDSINNREGYTYQSKNRGSGYEIQYALQGKNMRCGFGSDLSLTVAEAPGDTITVCVITR